MFHVKQSQLGAKIGPKTAGTEAKIRPSPRTQSQNLETLLVEQRMGISAVLSTPLIELPIQKPPLFVAWGKIVSRETIAIWGPENSSKNPEENSVTE